VSGVIGTRKIGAGKLAKKLNRFSIVGYCCIDFPIEATDKNVNFIEFNLGYPLTAAVVTANSLISRSIVLLRSAIHHISLMRRWTKIFVPIVEVIAVNVIWLHSLWAWANYLVHRQQSTACSADSNKAVARLASAPIELRERSVPVGTELCVEALCEWDYAIGWIKRLDNIVTLHGGLHDLSGKEIVRRSAAFNCLYFIMSEVI